MEADLLAVRRQPHHRHPTLGVWVECHRLAAERQVTASAPGQAVRDRAGAVGLEA
jgi:hypothetical protein